MSTKQFSVIGLLVVIAQGVLGWLLGRKKEAVRLKIYYQLDSSNPPIEHQGEKMILTVDQKVKLTIAPVDKYGNLAPVEGIVWANSDPTVVTLEVAPDALSAVVVTTGKVGIVQVAVTADAKIGEEIKEITGLVDFEVKGGEAISLGVVAGIPEAK
jgi:hypothetical protein